MTDGTPFPIPAGFVTAYLLPTGAELAYGYRMGWITATDVVSIALAKETTGAPMTEAEHDLALLLSDEFDRVEDLVAILEIDDEPAELRARVWLYLALAWLHEHRADFEDPFGVIELLYADFDYPDEMKGLVRYMPVEPGEPTGMGAMEARWSEYLEHTGHAVRSRPDGS